MIVVLANVLHDLLREIACRLEDTAVSEIPFNFREPEFDLIEPRGVRGCEMEPDLRILLEEFFDSLCFVGGQVVED